MACLVLRVNGRRDCRIGLNKAIVYLQKASNIIYITARKRHTGLEKRKSEFLGEFPFKTYFQKTVSPSDQQMVLSHYHSGTACLVQWGLWWLNLIISSNVSTSFLVIPLFVYSLRVWWCRNHFYGSVASLVALCVLRWAICLKWSRITSHQCISFHLRVSISQTWHYNESSLL